jgi:hypothetical protein
MLKAIAASVVLVAIAGCSSGSNSTPGTTTKAARLAEPDIRIVQTSGVPAAAVHSDGPLSVHYAMRVENMALEPITLKQVTVQSVSEGAYYVSPTTKPFNVVIDPKQRQEVEFWASAQPAGSVVGANGPVTLRVTCVFESANGKFQQIVMRRVNERADITGMQ